MNDRRDTIDGLMIFMKKHLPCSETGLSESKTNFRRCTTAQFCLLPHCVVIWPIQKAQVRFDASERKQKLRQIAKDFETSSAAVDHVPYRPANCIHMHRSWYWGVAAAGVCAERGGRDQDVAFVSSIFARSSPCALHRRSRICPDVSIVLVFCARNGAGGPPGRKLGPIQQKLLGRASDCPRTAPGGGYACPKEAVRGRAAVIRV
jgi:hypothetical protein